MGKKKKKIASAIQMNQFIPSIWVQYSINHFLKKYLLLFLTLVVVLEQCTSVFCVNPVCWPYRPQEFLHRATMRARITVLKYKFNTQVYSMHKKTCKEKNIY